MSHLSLTTGLFAPNSQTTLYISSKIVDNNWHRGKKVIEKFTPYFCQEGINWEKTTNHLLYYTVNKFTSAVKVITR